MTSIESIVDLVDMSSKHTIKYILNELLNRSSPNSIFYDIDIDSVKDLERVNLRLNSYHSKRSNNLADILSKYLSEGA